MWHSASSGQFLRFRLWLLLISSVLCVDDDCQNVIAACSSSRSGLAFRYTEGVDSIRDVLPQICEYLNIRDLSSTRSVCRTFKWAVDEVLKRRGPEIRISEIREFWPVTEKLAKPLAEAIQFKPKAVLFFIDKLSTTPIVHYDSVPHELITHYLPQLPKHSTIFTVLGSQIVDNATRVLSHENNALGLYLPDREGIKIETNALAQEFGDNWADPEVVNDFFAKLVPQKQGVGGLILFNLHSKFSNRGYSYNEKILSQILEMYKKDRKNFALWGASVSHMTTTVHYPDIEVSSFYTTISGPRVKCWSLKINHRDSEEKKRRKISEFKKHIKINVKKTVALSLQILDLSETDKTAIERNQIFSSAFPDVRLMTFGRMAGPIYCLDTLGDEPDANKIELTHGSDVICYLIISYI